MLALSNQQDTLQLGNFGKKYARQSFWGHFTWIWKAFDSHWYNNNKNMFCFATD